MFGNKKQALEEEVRVLKKQVKDAKDHYEKVIDSKETMDANLAEIRSSKKQVEKVISQVAENASNEVVSIQDNINAEASLIYELEHIVMDLNSQSAELDAIKTGVNDTYNDLLEMVDASKHYTSLSKALQDFSGELSSQNNSYVNYLNYMTDYSKQMGVLALNAAIEAGRLGDEGKQFVDAAEEIRVFVGNYNNTIEKMQNKIEESNEKIAAMDDKIKHLINLLKDNSIAAGKIMKATGENGKKLKSISNEPFRTGISSARNELIHVKNVDEELLKTVERNRIQISDMESEFDFQMKNESEFLDKLQPLFDEAERNSKEMTKEDMD